jgi:hypothetical protein
VCYPMPARLSAARLSHVDSGEAPRAGDTKQKLAMCAGVSTQGEAKLGDLSCASVA